MLSCLFVGLGGIGQRHLRNLRAVVGDSVELSAFRIRGEEYVLDDDLSIVETEGLCSGAGIRVFDDLEDALAQRPDFCFVANPTSLHISVALSAVEAGCDVFIETPISHNMDGIAELIRRTEQKRVIGFVAHQLHYHPAFQQMKSWLAQSEVGRVLAVDAEVGDYLPNLHPYEDYRQMGASRRELGGGAVLTHIQEIDYLLALFGVPRRVFASGGKISSLDLDVEDYASSTLEFQHPDGRVLPVNLRQDYLQQPARRGCRILGELGSIEWDIASHSLTLTSREGAIDKQHLYADVPPNQVFLAQMRDFLSCVAERRIPDVGLRVGASSLETALAIRRSIETGQPQLVASVAAMLEPVSDVFPTARRVPRREAS
jgi:predicted dehydrogenase